MPRQKQMTEAEIVELFKSISSDGTLPSRREYRVRYRNGGKDEGWPCDRHIDRTVGGWSKLPTLTGLKRTKAHHIPSMDITKDDFHAELRKMGRDGYGPNRTYFDQNRPMNWPTAGAFVRRYGPWKEHLAAVGLVPPKKENGQNSGHHLSKIDAELFEAMGWTPTDPHTLRKLAHLPSQGLLTLPKRVERQWDWHRMAYVECEVYPLR